MDEVGITNFQKPYKILARKRFKKSAEKGTLVTMAFAVSALDNIVPPYFIFP